MAKEAIFFDDLAKNIENVGTCIGIEAVKVSPGSKAPNPETADKNFYAVYLATKGMSVQYYEGSGIGLSEIPVIRNWLANTPKYAIFDWDQTLTQCAGIYLPIGENNRNDYTLKDRFALDLGGAGLKVPNDAVEQTLNYLFGGPQRLLIIRQLMQKLHDNDVKIIILTNNSTALLRPFEQLVEELLGKIPFRIICSARDTPANTNKRRAIEMDEELGTLCSYLEASLPPSANALVATVPPKGSGKLTAALAAEKEINSTNEMLSATMPSTYRRGGGGTRRKHKRRTIKLRRFMRRLKATRHRRNGTRSRIYHT